MIKRVLTFVSGVQEFVLLDFLSQNLHTVKTCLQKFPYKNEKTYFLYVFF